MNTYTLLKSKDDYSFEHYKTSPLSKMTGFTGTAGEAVLSPDKSLILFVDPRYHIQAENQTAGKNVKIIKMGSQYGFLEYLKETIGCGVRLLIPCQSTSYEFFQKLKGGFTAVEPYSTPDDKTPIDDDTLPVFEISSNISGKSAEEKLKELRGTFLITNLEEIAYLLNLRSFKTKNASTFRAKLFIENNNFILFTDYKTPYKSRPLAEYPDFIKNYDGKIQTDLKSISLFDYNLIKKPVLLEKNPVKAMASIKNENETAHYKKCFKRLDNALFEFKKRIKAGLSEFELNRIFEEELIKEGAKCTSFETILAIDENSSVIHYTANSKEKILKPGGIILLDCGGYYEGGYATDITRVFLCPGGDVPSLIKEIYTAVLSCQLNIYHSKSLMTDELHNMAASILKPYEKSGFFFPHGLGHGIGIPVHQSPPVLSPNTPSKLQNGNVFTIEPGLYCAGKFGIRLENSVYLKNNEKISLSRFPYEKELIDFEKLSKQEKIWLEEWL